MKQKITVLGRPVPKGRPRVVRTTHGRTRTYNEPRSEAWEEAVAWAGRSAGVKFGKAELSATIHLYSLTVLTGDLDNYAKAILDGLQRGEVYANDKQIRRLDVRTVVGAADKVVIHLEEL